MKNTLFCLLLGVSSVTFAENAPQKYLEIKKVDTATLSPGKVTRVLVKIQVMEGLHVQANPASLPNLKPTMLVFPNQNGLEFQPVTYPEGKPYRMLNAAQDISVYEGMIELKLPIKAVNAKPGRGEVKGELKYQACNDKICFFPRSEPIVIQTLTLKN
jgi:hypothetical protein